jgi:DNA-binding HxlR family transcriptional regulator
MFTKPVETHIEILRILMPKQLNVNEIYRQTGLSYKQGVTQAIRDLEKGGLVTRIKNKKHTQKEYIQLTQLGHEIADIANNVQEYKRSLIELSKREEEYIDSPEKTIEEDLKIMKRKGLGDQDISWYKEWKVTTSFIQLYSYRNFVDILINRYALSLYPLNITDITKAMMNSLLMDATTFRLSHMLEDIEYYHDMIDRSFFEHFNAITQMTHELHPIPNIIYKEVRDVLMSYFSLLKLPKEMVIEELEPFHKLKQDKIKEISQQNDIKYYLHIFEEYISKST